FNVFHIKILTGLLNNFTYLRIVYMRYFRKKMVFYLKIQTSNQPTDHFILSGKICRGFNLMNCPFVFYFIGVGIRYREMGFFYSMRQLKHGAEDESSKHSQR